MLAKFDPDEIVRKIESAEEKLDAFIDGGNAAVDRVQNVADVIDKQVGSVGSGSSPIADDGASEPDETTETASLPS